MLLAVVMDVTSNFRLKEEIMPKTRRDFFKNAGMAMAAGALGFPALGRGQAYADTPTDAPTTGLLPAGVTASSPHVATNGYLSALLPLHDQQALRQINVSMTQLAIQQCALDGVANQIAFDTLICEALAAFALHGVSSDDLLQLSRRFGAILSERRRLGGQ